MIAILFSRIAILIRSNSVHKAAFCADDFANGREKACITALKDGNRTPDDATGVTKAAIRALKVANGTLNMHFRTPVAAIGVLKAAIRALIAAFVTLIVSFRSPEAAVRTPVGAKVF
jgi:hypothetical protein